MTGDSIPLLACLRVGVVEHFDVVEYVLPCFKSGLISFAPDALTLQQIKEAFGDGIVVTVTPAAHAVFDVVLLQE